MMKRKNNEKNGRWKNWEISGEEEKIKNRSVCAISFVMYFLIFDWWNWSKYHALIDLDVKICEIRMYDQNGKKKVKI